MKKVLFCALAVAGMLTAQQAVAADYCCPPQYDPCCCETEFDGFYFGGNLGVISHMAHRNDLDGFFDDGLTSLSRCTTDVTVGLQLGYDWQCCNSVFGLVVDWNWVNVDHDETFDRNTSTSSRRLKSDFDWFTTIRARAGLTVCDALLYVTAGAAVASFDNEWRNVSTATPASDRRFKHCDTKWGWVGGVGAEFGLGCNWTIGVEVLTLHFCHNNERFDSNFHFSLSDTAWVGRILLNYRFGDLCCF